MPKRAAPVEETKQEAPKTPEKAASPEKEEPAEPPEPWETHETHDGNTYYWNRLTGETSWDAARGAEAEGRGGPGAEEAEEEAVVVLRPAQAGAEDARRRGGTSFPFHL